MTKLLLALSMVVGSVVAEEFPHYIALGSYTDEKPKPKPLTTKWVWLSFHSGDGWEPIQLGLRSDGTVIWR